MNDAVFLERRYRRLLGWYPASFRKENEDEVLGVLMASARDGKRWPSAAEAADVLLSALRMRFRLPPAGSDNPGWSDAWAAFSVLAPVFLLVASLVVVEVPPYRLHVRSTAPWFNVNIAPHPGWLFYDAHAFYILLAFQVLAVVAVLAGRRWVALAVILGSAVYWGVTQGTYPEPVTLVTSAAYILEVVALLASPGPRRGRTLLTWGHGAVLLLAVAAVKLSSLTWWVIILPRAQTLGDPELLTDILLMVAAVLAIAAVIGPVVLRQGSYPSVLLAALLYPSAIEFVSLVFGSGSYGDLLQFDITPLHLVILFLMPLVVAVLAILIAARGRLASSNARLTPGS